MEKIFSKFMYVIGAALALSMIAGVICMVIVGIQTMYYIVSNPYYYQQELLALCLGQGALLMLTAGIAKVFKFSMDVNNL